MTARTPVERARDNLILLIQHAHTLLSRGDDLGPLPEDQRRVVMAAAQALMKRLLQHLGPADAAIGLDLICDMAMVCDDFVVHGDGLPVAMSDSDVGVTFALRQVLLSRGSSHPGGQTALRFYVGHPNARAAAERARALQRPAMPAPAAPAGLTAAPSPPAEAAAPPPAPEPVLPASVPPAPATEPLPLDSFTFGPSPLAPSPLDRPLDPPMPAAEQPAAAGNGTKA